MEPDGEPELYSFSVFRRHCWNAVGPLRFWFGWFNARFRFCLEIP
jgi:hypothetical protein